MKVCRGVTVIELLVTISVAAILLTLGVPSFIETVASNRVRVQSDAMMTALALARSEAIKRATRVTVCKSSNHVSCTPASAWNTGWIVFADRNASVGGAEGTLDGTEQVLRVFDGNPAVAIAPPAGETNFQDYVSYLPSGISDGGDGGSGADPTPSGSLRFCGDNTSHDRQISVNSTGRARVENITC